jgi:hypothetical protein
MKSPLTGLRLRLSISLLARPERIQQSAVAIAPGAA